MGGLNNGGSSLTTQNTFSTFLTGDAIKTKINEMIGGKDGQRFITSIISAVSTNPTLSDCEHASILSAAMLGESLKLSPSPQLGQYYLVPSTTKTIKKATISTARQQSFGDYKKINVWQ